MGASSLLSTPPLTTGLASPGVLIVSLDCEGKWGMADHLSRLHHTHMTNARLSRAYQLLVDLFRNYEVSATFAYVMAFVLSPAERREMADLLEPGARADPWMEHVWASWEAGWTEGWYLPDALDMVRNEGRHEIASHGFCHRPLDVRSISAHGAKSELAAAARAASLKGLAPTTFVYPRNQVGHLPALREAGFLGYRQGLPSGNSRLGRLVRLLQELNTSEAPQTVVPPRDDAPIPIPGGFFFNWRRGARRGVPTHTTHLRWRNLLDRAAGEGGVVHLWLHPHNLATAPSTAGVLEKVVAYAARLRDAGRITILTQEQYCDVVRMRDELHLNESPLTPSLTACG